MVGAVSPGTELAEGAGGLRDLTEPGGEWTDPPGRSRVRSSTGMEDLDPPATSGAVRVELAFRDRNPDVERRVGDLDALSLEVRTWSEEGRARGVCVLLLLGSEPTAFSLSDSDDAEAERRDEGLRASEEENPSKSLSEEELLWRFPREACLRRLDAATQVSSDQS